jgi:hypothetical protein
MQKLPMRRDIGIAWRLDHGHELLRPSGIQLSSSQKELGVARALGF